MASGRSRDLAGGQYPLLIFDDDVDVVVQDDETNPANRGRGRGRGKGRGCSAGRGRIRGRSSSDREPNQSNKGSEPYSKNNQSDKRRGQNGERRARFGHVRGTGRGQDQSRLRQDGMNESGLDHTNEDDSTRRQRSETRTMAFGKLKSLAEKECDPDDILMDLLQSRSGFVELIHSSFDYKDNAFYILKVLNIASKATLNPLNLRQLLENVHEKMLPALINLLSKIVMKDRSAFLLWNNEDKLDKFLYYVSDFTQTLMSVLPNTITNCHPIILSLNAMIMSFPQISRVSEYVNNVQEVFNKVREEKERSQAKPKVRTRPLYKDDENSTPPDDFRQIAIFPRMEDIHLNEAPFLRANKTKGRYVSVDTYLDIQFRLLREDYVKPLRQGILEYRQCVKEGVSVKRLRNVRIYQNIQILRPVCSSNGINHILQFDNSQFKHINWTASRRLLFGSLVCLSSDDFDTVLYATVTDRNPKNLSEGNIEVHFDGIDTEILDAHKNDTFVMAETTAYFEAYRYVLEGLQEMDETMPMSRYVIDCETQIKPPSYLLGHGGPKYNFGTLLVKSSYKRSFPVLNTVGWPSALELGLDTSQYKALQAAITKEFAIIQGPPGTGKTFVGLKIAKLLLENSAFWKTNADKSPILVVCFTNHALDQFLEGIYQYCGEEGIVRIGGRCQNDTLQPFVLRNLKKTRRDQKARTFKLMQSERDCRTQLRTSEKQITDISVKLRKTTQDILPFTILKRHMNDQHRKEFENEFKNEETLKNCLYQWLKFCPFEDDSVGLVDSSRAIRNEWVSFILTEVEPLPNQEIQTIDNVWNTDLSRRAGIYKCWQRECMQNITKELLSAYPGILKRCEEQILTFTEIQRLLVKPKSNAQLKSLLHGANNNKNCVHLWLNLDDSSTLETVKETMDEIQVGGHVEEKDTELEEADLEEDRALDDDDFDDDFLVGYSSKDHEKDNRKIKGIKSDGDWFVKWNSKKKAKKVKRILNEAKPMSERDAQNICGLFSLKSDKLRYSLYAFWLRNYREHLRSSVKEFENAFRDATARLQEVRDMETVQILNDSVVVGMTTTGAAKYRKLLQKVKPQLIIVEEAAEVLESHIITTLNANCKHLILIGDHKQLRPSTTVYELSKKYAMDISLFERMVKNSVPCVTLEEQHRMRPEISSLLRRERLYPGLRDHSSVFEYEKVKGVDVNMQFISHEEGEVCSGESTSYSNTHEAKYIAALCRYFLNQGYARDQITVLTPYMGQVLLLRKEMPKSLFEGVRITAVDNFQGEENDIILLSLVRSSEVGNVRGRNPIGFVGIENRICVALSRAKVGMFVLGNFSLFESCSDMWKEILCEVKEKGSVKSSLLLRCSNHPQNTTIAKTASDFLSVQEGGCKVPCGKYLPCEHICPRTCHTYDMEHKKVVCVRPCKKAVKGCPFGHPCTKKCHQECGRCATNVEKTVPVCGHKAKMACYMDPYKWDCKEQCPTILSCGHPCGKKCSDCTKNRQHENQCKKKVERILPCGHTVRMLCYHNIKAVVCPAPCSGVHDCGHQCSGTCGLCHGGRIHKTCRGSCGKTLPCGHKCTYPCSDICPPCSQICQWSCSHGLKCKLKCSQPCVRCTEKCQYRCQHGKCDNDCHEPCTVSAACNGMCSKILPCTHKCSGLCGEVCVCLTCNEKHLRNDIGQVFDESSMFMQLPDCKCIFEVERLDKHMKTPTQSKRGSIIKACPFDECGKAIRSEIKRYSSILKGIRSAVVQKFEELQGNGARRQYKIAELTKKTHSMKALGMADADIVKLLKPLQTQTFGGVHITEKKLEKIEDIMKQTQIIQDAKKQKLIGDFQLEGILDPLSLKDIILEERRFATNQFWDEISTEIERIEIGLRFALFKAFCKNNEQQPIFSELLEMSFQVLAKKDFDIGKREELKSASKELKSFLDGKTTSLDLMVTLTRLQLACTGVGNKRQTESNRHDSNRKTEPVSQNKNLVPRKSKIGTTKVVGAEGLFETSV